MPAGEAFCGDQHWGNGREVFVHARCRGPTEGIGEEEDDYAHNANHNPRERCASN
jgi:hypothetical protein